MSARGTSARTAGRVLTRDVAGVLDAAELDGLPEPVRRYFAASIAEGAPCASSTTIRMRGHIKLGRWLPFRASEVLDPHRGFIWRARAAGVISGHDALLDGRGEMRWKLLGLVDVLRAEGSDVSRSAAGRCGGEALWLPTALLPRFGVAWSAESDRDVVARFTVHTTSVELRLTLDESGLPVAVVFDRWGDPDGSGSFGTHRFGGTITGYGTFSGITIPTAGRWGWHFGTDQWDGGEFFRCRITRLKPHTTRRRVLRP